MAVVGHMLRDHIGDPPGRAQPRTQRQHRLKSTGGSADAGNMHHAGVTVLTGSGHWQLIIRRIFSVPRRRRRQHIDYRAAAVALHVIGRAAGVIGDTVDICFAARTGELCIISSTTAAIIVPAIVNGPGCNGPGSDRMIPVTGVNNIPPIVGNPCRCSRIDLSCLAATAPPVKLPVEAAPLRAYPPPPPPPPAGVGDSNAADKHCQHTDDTAGNQNLLQLPGCACFHF